MYVLARINLYFIYEIWKTYVNLYPHFLYLILYKVIQNQSSNVKLTSWHLRYNGISVLTNERSSNFNYQPLGTLMCNKPRLQICLTLTRYHMMSLEGVILCNKSLWSLEQSCSQALTNWVNVKIQKSSALFYLNMTENQNLNVWTIFINQLSIFKFDKF